MHPILWYFVVKPGGHHRGRCPNCNFSDSMVVSMVADNSMAFVEIHMKSHNVLEVKTVPEDMVKAVVLP